jgi:hypothetical protein
MLQVKTGFGGNHSETERRRNRAMEEGKRVRQRGKEAGGEEGS